jgi:hypothetical protein
MASFCVRDAETSGSASTVSQLVSYNDVRSGGTCPASRLWQPVSLDVIYTFMCFFTSYHEFFICLRS